MNSESNVLMEVVLGHELPKTKQRVVEGYACVYLPVDGFSQHTLAVM